MTTTEPTPHLLHQAATQLRQHATAAEHDVETNPYWRSELTDRPGWYANGVRNGLGGPSGELAALMHPGVGTALADWLGCLAMLDPSDRGGDRCGWCGGNHAAAVARALLGAGEVA